MTDSPKQLALTQSYLHKILHYDAETGVFTWRVRMGSQALVGRVAGTTSKRGQRSIAIRRRIYLASRLAWFYVHGRWPLQVDHINLDKTDNRLANLRETDRKGNAANRPVFKEKVSCSLKGVTYRGDRYGKKRWRARIRVDGRLISLGDYETPDLAHQAYWRAAQQHFGEFARAA